MLKIAEAKKELSEKTLDQIQRETAWKWASRAVASFENTVDAANEKKLTTFLAGQEYLHEAIEHASLVDDGDGDLVDDVKKAIKKSLNDAIEDVENSLGIEL